jgi:RNA polymerase sigma-70 factor (ECF subfamily)
MRFDDLVRQHAVDLYRYAFWLARDRSRAEDIVQEALLRGWRAYPRLRAQGAAKSWLFSIVRNEYLRVAAATQAQPESLSELDIPDDRPAERGLEMREALAALPAAYAEPLALQVLGGFSCAEIAALLGTTEGATMTRLTRARQALRRLIAPSKERRGGRS